MEHFETTYPKKFSGPASKSKAKKVKFIDDGTVTVSINLKQCLVPHPIQRHQFYLDDTEKFTIENQFKEDQNNVI